MISLKADTAAEKDRLRAELTAHLGQLNRQTTTALDWAKSAANDREEA